MLLAYSAITPALAILFGFIVAFVALALFLPMIRLIQSLTGPTGVM
jgi:type II secretory pathway component PulF